MRHRHKASGGLLAGAASLMPTVVPTKTAGKEPVHLDTQTRRELMYRCLLRG